jgi:hypothetical protein
MLALSASNASDATTRDPPDERPSSSARLGPYLARRIQGLLVDPDHHRVTHVLLQERHLGGRKKVSMPVSAVTGVENGIWLSLTKKQVEDMPPAD